jgi:hypothetical protein
MSCCVILIVCSLGVGSGLLAILLGSVSLVRPAIVNILVLATVACCSYVISISLAQSFSAKAMSETVVVDQKRSATVVRMLPSVVQRRNAK